MLESETFRWGILGCGNIAAKFAADLPSSYSGALMGTASRNQEKVADFAEKFGGVAFPSMEELIHSPEVDGIYISLPNTLHREWTMKALTAGKHVLCEKPLSLSAGEAREMFEHAAECGRILTEAFMYRAHPQTHALFRLVKDGVIGSPRLIRANFTFSRTASAEDARYQPNAGGGSLMDVGCYCTDFIRTIAGQEPTQAHAVPHWHDLGVDDYAAGTLAFESGLLATFTCGMTVVSDQSAHIAGTEGRIEITRFWQGKEGFTVHRPNGESSFHSVEETRPIYAVEADGFADIVRGEDNWNPPANSIANMETLDLLRNSWTR